MDIKNDSRETVSFFGWKFENLQAWTFCDGIKSSFSLRKFSFNFEYKSDDEGLLSSNDALKNL